MHVSQGAHSDVGAAKLSSHGEPVKRM